MVKTTGNERKTHVRPEQALAQCEENSSLRFTVKLVSLSNQIFAKTLAGNGLRRLENRVRFRASCRAKIVLDFMVRPERFELPTY
jgi:hypothetical protein